MYQDSPGMTNFLQLEDTCMLRWLREGRIQTWSITKASLPRVGSRTISGSLFPLTLAIQLLPSKISLVKAIMALLLTTATEDIIVRMVYHVPMSSAPLGSGLLETCSRRQQTVTSVYTCWVVAMKQTYIPEAGNGKGSRQRVFTIPNLVSKLRL